jgi:hypothetical protein
MIRAFFHLTRLHTLGTVMDSDFEDFVIPAPRPLAPKPPGPKPTALEKPKKKTEKSVVEQGSAQPGGDHAQASTASACAPNPTKSSAATAKGTRSFGEFFSFSIAIKFSRVAFLTRHAC